MGDVDDAVGAGQSGDFVACGLAAGGRDQFRRAAREVERAAILEIVDLDTVELLEPMPARGKETVAVHREEPGALLAAPDLLAFQVGFDDRPAQFAHVPGQQHPVAGGANRGRSAMVGTPGARRRIGLVARLAGVVHRHHEFGGDWFVIDALPGVFPGGQRFAVRAEAVPALDVLARPALPLGDERLHHRPLLVEERHAQFALLRRLVGEGQRQRQFGRQPLLDQRLGEVAGG